MIAGLRRNLKEDIVDALGLEQVLWRLFGKDETDHRAVLLDLAGNFRVMDLEPDDGSFWDLLDGARGPNAIVAAGRICGQEIIDLVVPPELVGNLGRIIKNGLVGFHPNQKAIPVERRSIQGHIYREVALLLIHVREAGRAARYSERDYMVDNLSVA